MTLASLSRTDVSLRDSVLQELAWDTQVDASGIGVAAKEDAVTLTGFIDSYAGKLAAERAVKRIHGVRAVANDIQVRLRLDRTDEQIAGDAAHALALRATLPAGVQAAVHSGHVTLTGTVSSLFQRAVAEKAIHDLKGVKEIVNRIEVKPGASANSIKRDIVRALHRRGRRPGSTNRGHVNGNAVRLAGTDPSGTNESPPSGRRRTRQAPLSSRMGSRCNLAGRSPATSTTKSARARCRWVEEPGTMRPRAPWRMSPRRAEPAGPPAVWKVPPAARSRYTDRDAFGLRFSSSTTNS